MTQAELHRRATEILLEVAEIRACPACAQGPCAAHPKRAIVELLLREVAPVLVAGVVDPGQGG